jgi:hypothetical protein
MSGSGVLNIGHKLIVVGLMATTGMGLYTVGSGAAMIVGRRMDRKQEQQDEAAAEAAAAAAHAAAAPATPSS